MKKISRVLKLPVIAVLSLTLGISAFADLPPDNVQGDWTIYSTNIENGDTVVKHVQIAQYEDRITGYFEGPVQSGPIQGRVDGHHIVFSTVTRTVLTFRGQIYGDNMSGLYGIHGKHAPWQAARPAAATVTPVPPSTGTVYQAQPAIAPTTQSAYQYPAPAPVLAPVPSPQSMAAPTTSDPAQGSHAPTPVPLSPDQLDSLVAPIALYPDALLAQVLAATTNPDQIAYADDWLAQNRSLTGTGLAQAVDQQSWDPSIKALTQFSSVLDNLAHNLSWTSSLGQAFANQQPDVMAAVQRMRAKAQAAGTLQSNSQITVAEPSPTTIVIQPANPEVVYVPQYNPTIIYGAPVVVPFYVPPPLPVARVGIFFGSGIAIGGTFGGGWAAGFGWGWHAWNVNWGCCGGGGSTTIIYNHTTYINNRTYNGYHAWGPGGRGYYGANGYYHPDPGYHPGADTHYGPHGGYHPNGYFGPNGGWHPDVPGTNPKDQPNGSNNGNHGLIGGSGAVQRTAQAPNAEGQMVGQSRNNNDHSSGVEQNRSRFSGDGISNRAESNRGRKSLSRARQPRMGREHATGEHRSGGGEGRRRG